MILTKEILNPYVVSLVGSETLAELWWTTPNKAFHAECPETADLELVRDYLMWHCFAAGG